MSDESRNKQKNYCGLRMIFAIVEMLGLCLANLISPVLAVVALVFNNRAKKAYEKKEWTLYNKHAKTSNILLIVGLVVNVLAVVFWMTAGADMYKSVKNLYKEENYNSYKELVEDLSEEEGSLEDRIENIKKEEDTQSSDKEDEPTTEKPLSKIGKYWAFSLDGVKYEMPFAASELYENGYRVDIQTSENELIPPMGVVENYLYDKEEHFIGTIEVYNPHGEEKPQKDCMVIALYFSGNVELQDGWTPDFKIDNGVSFGMTREEVRAILGEPAISSEDEDVMEDLIEEDMDADDELAALEELGDELTAEELEELEEFELMEDVEEIESVEDTTESSDEEEFGLVYDYWFPDEEGYYNYLEVDYVDNKVSDILIGCTGDFQMPEDTLAQ